MKALSVFPPIPPVVFFSLLLASVLLFPSRLAHAQSYQVLHSFTGPTGDGSWPNEVVREPDGTLYGVTCYGGVSYYGSAFSFSTQGKETILYNFLAGYGSCPNSLLSWNGQFYGTTERGGSEKGGAIFRLSNNGDEVVLHNFTGGPPRNCISAMARETFTELAVGARSFTESYSGPIAAAT